jgi:2-phospho-L-lactate guanylyltransferase (CobY/MobA/RfbA family)
LKEVDGVLVVSRDPNANDCPQSRGAHCQEDGQQLNTALKRATIVRSMRPAGFATRRLPLVTREDILALIQRAVEPPVVVIAPDRHKKAPMPY